MVFKYIWYICIFLIHIQTITKVILVTGGAGFIGSHVCERLLQRGDEVIIIDNLDSFYDPHIKIKHLNEIKKSDIYNTLTIYITDICDKQKIKTIFDHHSIDTVCHLAARASVRLSIKNPIDYFKTNIVGTAIIFEEAQKHKIKNIVFASSSSVYGERSDKNQFKESDRTDHQPSPYGMSKKAGELLAATYFHLYKMPITCLRFFNVYGPRGRRDMSPYIFMDAIYNQKQFTIFGDGSILRDFTYIDDIVDGIIKAIDNPLGFEILNLGRGEPITILTLVKTLEEVIGKNADIIFEDSLSCDVPATHASIVRTKQLLSYNPQYSIKEGIERMFLWYLNEHIKKEQLQH